MKIGILSQEKKSYSTRRLVEAGRKRGHMMRVIETMRCYMNITSSNPTIRYRGNNLCDFDAIIPRIGPSITFYGTAVVRQFELMGVFCVNKSVAISSSRDKLRALQLLSSMGVGLPATGYARSPDDVEDLIHIVGGPPLVIKLLEGTQGIGVVLAETRKEAESVIEAFLGLNVNIMVQEYIKESGGEDIRCFVVENRVVAAIRRKAKDGDFRSNIHRGGTAVPEKITPEERRIAVRAAHVMGLKVAGVDLLRSDRGPLVMEVNSSPGLKAIETATKKDIAGSIIEFIENQVKTFRMRACEKE